MGECQLCEMCQPLRLSAPLRGRPANDNERQVRLPTISEILQIPFNLRLAAETRIAMRVLGLSRRRFMEYVVSVIVSFKGTVCLANGQVFPLPANFLDNAFGDTDASSDGRWLSDWIRLRLGTRRQRPHRKLVSRLACIWLALQIDRGHIDFHRRERVLRYLRRRAARKPE